MKDLALVGICIPSRSEWAADFALSLAGMLLAFGKHPLPGYKQTGVIIINKRGSILPQLRYQLVDEALKKECTHLLFLDSDMYFPSSLAHQLIDLDKDIIGCNCATKSIPASPTARLKDHTDEGAVLYGRTDAKHGDYKKVWRLGFGVMLIKAEVFTKMPRPWFGIDWSPERQEFYGEDWVFCKNAEAAGYDIWVDEFASGAIGHIGTFMYTHGEVQYPEEPQDAKV